jgi:hypothetical protein
MNDPINRDLRSFLVSNSLYLCYLAKLDFNLNKVPDKIITLAILNYSLDEASFIDFGVTSKTEISEEIHKLKEVFLKMNS